VGKVIKYQIAIVISSREGGGGGGGAEPADFNTVSDMLIP